MEYLKTKFQCQCRTFKVLCKKHGPWFLAYAILIEFIEDVVLPLFLCAVGKPYLVPAALAFHMEPVAYPLYFVMRSVLKGR